MIYRLSDMIYGLAPYDIFALQNNTRSRSIREAYIICAADIIPAGYIIRDQRERISFKRRDLRTHICALYSVV